MSLNTHFDNTNRNYNICLYDASKVVKGTTNCMPFTKVMHNSSSSSSRICLIALDFQLLIASTERKKKVPFKFIWFINNNN